MTTAQATVCLTPEMLAESFWRMGSDEQIQFFDALAKVIKDDHKSGNASAYALGELQWHFVEHDLRKPENRQARDMLMTIAAPLYLHTLMYAERQQ